MTVNTQGQGQLVLEEMRKRILELKVEVAHEHKSYMALLKEHKELKKDLDACVKLIALQETKLNEGSG